MRADERHINGDDTLRERGEQKRDVLTFTVGGEVYALGIEHIREIIKNRPITEVPRVPSFVAGIIAVRGVVMPVIDLRLRLRLQAHPLSRQARILVVTQPQEAGADVGREPFGLLVDHVHHVVRLPESDIEPPTMLSGHEADFVSGIGRVLTEGEDPKGKTAGKPRVLLILLDLFRVLSFEHQSLAHHGHGHGPQALERGSLVDGPLGKGRDKAQGLPTPFYGGGATIRERRDG